MQYFAIVFGAFIAVLSGYIWILNAENHAIRDENLKIRVMLESQKKEFNAQKIEYLEKVEKAKNASLNKLILNTESCQAELDSYKALIRAM